MATMKNGNPLRKFLFIRNRPLTLDAIAEGVGGAQRSQVLSRWKAKLGAVTPGRLVRENVLADGIRVRVWTPAEGCDEVGVHIHRQTVLYGPKDDRRWHVERCTDV